MERFKTEYDRLMTVARRRTGQSENVAQFLLAWYNSKAWGGWAPYSIYGLDRPIQADILAVLAEMASKGPSYPDSADMEELIRMYHPEQYQAIIALSEGPGYN